MGRRELTPAELQQRRNAAKNGGRPRRNEGTPAARKAVGRAREIIRRSQPEAARMLVAAMQGKLAPELADAQVAAALQLLNRGGNPIQTKIDSDSLKTAPSFVIGVDGMVKPDNDADPGT
jgi:hypothetical protein